MAVYIQPIIYNYRRHARGTALVAEGMAHDALRQYLDRLLQADVQAYVENFYDSDGAQIYAVYVPHAQAEAARGLVHVTS